MQHDIIDNRSDLLVEHIRSILETTESAKFAVGYFFIVSVSCAIPFLLEYETCPILEYPSPVPA